MVFSEILQGLVQWTLGLIETYGPYSVFVAVILEELLLPIPAPLVIMGAGFLLVPPGLPFWDAAARIFFVIVIPASLASTIGSFFTYGIGYYGGRPAINKFHKSLGISWLDVRKIEKRLEKGRKVWTTIAVLRAIPFFPVAFVSFISGVLRLSRKKYALATFIGSVPRTFILAIAGWRVGAAYVELANKISSLEYVIALAVVIGIIYFLYRFRHKYVHHVHRYKNALIRTGKHRRKK